MKNNDMKKVLVNVLDELNDRLKCANSDFSYKACQAGTILFIGQCATRLAANKITSVKVASQMVNTSKFLGKYANAFVSASMASDVVNFIAKKQII